VKPSTGIPFFISWWITRKSLEQSATISLSSREYWTIASCLLPDCVLPASKPNSLRFTRKLRN
jgi:hypothetical protein